MPPIYKSRVKEDDEEEFVPQPSKKVRGVEYENIPQKQTRGVTIDRPDPDAGDSEAPHESKDKEGKIYYWRRRKPTS